VIFHRIAGRLWLSFTLAALLSGCGGESHDSIRNLGSAGQTIICFGDSLTEGIGGRPGEDYPSILAQRLGVRVINAGRRGDTTAVALARLAADVLEKNPRLVVVMLGGNDFLRQVPLSDTKKHLEEIVRRTQDRGAMVVVSGIRLGLFTDEYGPIFEEIAARRGALYVPEVLKGILSDAKLRSDRIHPNGSGYRLIAERIAEKVKPLLEAADRRRRGLVRE
jgi:acyl-CoA thioesterase-1